MFIQTDTFLQYLKEGNKTHFAWINIIVYPAKYVPVYDTKKSNKI